MENITKQRDADKESGEEKRIWFKRGRSLCVCLYDRETAKRKKDRSFCLLLPAGLW